MRKLCVALAAVVICALAFGTTGCNKKYPSGAPEKKRTAPKQPQAQILYKESARSN